MPNYLTPGVHVEERSSGNKPIAGVSTSTAVFVGAARKGPINQPTLVTNFSEFQKNFGGPYRLIKGVQEHEHYLYYTVRHFFEQGGGKCYVVRVAHYTDINIPDSLEALSSSTVFDGVDAGGGSVSPALNVSAINPGEWGDSLEVRVFNTSKYAVRLAGDVEAGTAVEKMTLVDNDEVREGALLWIVEEVTGTVTVVNKLSNQIEVEAINWLDASSFTGTLPSGVSVYSSDFEFQSEVPGDVDVTSGTPQDSFSFDDIRKVDGNTELRTGDTLNFAISSVLLIVNKITPSPPEASIPGMEIHFDQQNLASRIQAARARVYALDFTLQVREGDEILESHEHLSLVSSNMADYIDHRLGIDTGHSLYVTAEAAVSENELVLLNNNDFNSESSMFTASLHGGNDGLAGLSDTDFLGSEFTKTGLHALDVVKDASIICVPNATEIITGGVISYCDRRKDLFYIMDHPSSSSDDIKVYTGKFSTTYAAIYHPWLKVADAITGNEISVPSSGAIAGIFAKTDVKRGVHKAPAGFDTGKITVAKALEEIVSKPQYDILYQEKINAIRKLPSGFHIWGTRTISADSEWKYINVRRLFIFLEQSIERGTQWVAFEPNDRSLWKSIERNIKAFLRIQWREGKLVGETEEQAFFVVCNEETNPQEVIDAGQVVTLIGVAPSKPAEFLFSGFNKRLDSLKPDKFKRTRNVRKSTWQNISLQQFTSKRSRQV